MKRAAETPVWNSPRRRESALPERAAADLAEMARVGDQMRLFTLLALDGAPDLEVMPYKAESLRLLDRDRAEGRVADDVDLEALHVLLVAVTAGYSLFRDRFAAEIQSDAGDLDDRVAGLLGDLLRRGRRRGAWRLTGASGAPCPRRSQRATAMSAVDHARGPGRARSL